MISHSSCRVGLWAVLSVLGCALARTAVAAEPWEQLPPTATLPADTHGHYADIHGARIWYAQWGPRDARIPVLLLHGGYANSNYFGHLIPVLIAHGYRVIAMDSRGHGRSTRSPGPITYHMMADDVIRLLDQLHVPQVSLVGWSDGGCIGYDLAIHHPQRLRRLFAFGADSDPSGLEEGFDQNPVFAAYLARVREEYRKLSPTPRGWDEFNSALNTMWSTLPNYTAAQLRSIRVPTTIADGAYDEGIKPQHDRYLAETIPHARLVILPNVSHFAMLQDPAAFNAAVLRFLQD